MPVTNSQITEDRAQADGRRWVTESHTLSTGDVRKVTYLADAGLDAPQVMASRVPAINAAMVEEEFGRLVSHVSAGQSMMTFPFTDLTLAQGASRLFAHTLSLSDPRPMKSYAQVVAATPAATIASLLGVDQTRAAAVIQWASSVVSTINTQDASKAAAATAIGG